MAAENSSGLCGSDSRKLDSRRYFLLADNSPSDRQKTYDKEEEDLFATIRVSEVSQRGCQRRQRASQVKVSRELLLKIAGS